MNIDFPEDSDTSDEDYVPSGPGNTAEVPSEVDSDGDPEDPLSDADEAGERSAKRRKKLTKSKKKAKVVYEESTSAEASPVKKELTEEEKKKHADSLWASFKKDTGFKKKPENAGSSQEAAKSESVENKVSTINKIPEKIKVTQVFEFAGEEVKIEKEVAVDSAEARLVSNPTSSAPSARGKGRGRGGLGGIGSVLSQIGRKQKLSTLEKSQLDWNKFKKEEEIEEELDHYKKGKDAYLDKQDFLERADLRRFEIEREVRAVERNKRLNMNNAQ